MHPSHWDRIRKLLVLMLGVWACTESAPGPAFAVSHVIESGVDDQDLTTSRSFCRVRRDVAPELKGLLKQLHASVHRRYNGSSIASLGVPFPPCAGGFDEHGPSLTRRSRAPGLSE